MFGTSTEGPGERGSMEPWDTQIRPENGLVAGCPVAKDILEAYLGPAATVTVVGQARQYVDDFVLSVEADTPAETADVMVEEIRAVKAALQRQGMVLNDTKEQLLIATAAGRREWQRVAPHYPGRVAEAAKDLGVCQRRRGVRNQVAEARAKPLAEVCRRIGYLPLERSARLHMAAALVSGAGLYGSEVDKPNRKIFQALRVAMSRAAWGDNGPRNRRAALLLQQEGKYEPCVMWARKTAGNGPGEPTGVSLDGCGPGLLGGNVGRPRDRAEASPS